MKKRMEFLCTTAIFSGILLLLLGILFAAVLSAALILLFALFVLLFDL